MHGDDGEIVVLLGGTIRPPGGIVVVSPSLRPLRRIVVDGLEQAPTHPHHVLLASATATLRMCY